MRNDSTAKIEKWHVIFLTIMLILLLMLVLMAFDFAGVAYAEAETSGVISDDTRGRV